MKKIKRFNEESPSILDEDNVPFCLAYSGHWHDKNSRADEIVRAVNNHDDLVAMVATLVDQVDGNPLAIQFFDPRLINNAKELLKEATK